MKKSSRRFDYTKKTALYDEISFSGFTKILFQGALIFLCLFVCVCVCVCVYACIMYANEKYDCYVLIEVIMIRPIAFECFLLMCMCRLVYTLFFCCCQGELLAQCTRNTKNKEAVLWLKTTAVRVTTFSKTERGTLFCTFNPCQ